MGCPMTKKYEHYILYDLKCNYRVTPLGIECECPGFSWKIQKIDPLSPGVSQHAYQLLLMDDAGVLIWDSGKVVSHKQNQVLYDGCLKPHSWYTWIVRIWDDCGNSSSWSDPQHFLTGLPEKDWSGAWITYAGLSGIDSFHDHIWIRREIHLKEMPVSGILYVASAGLHDVYINGVKADDRVLVPDRGILQKDHCVIFYETYDISHLLHRGKNIIGIAMDAGYMRLLGLPPALRIQLHTDQCDYHSDETWKCRSNHNGYPGTFQLGDHGGEITVYPAFVTDWSTPSYDDSEWVPLRKITVPYHLQARRSNPNRIIRILQPVSLTPGEPCIVDMGENFTGWFAIQLPKLTSPVVIEVSDKPNERCTFHQKIIYMPGLTHGTWYYSQFNYISGRYFTISGLPIPLKKENIKGFVISNLTSPNGNFNCSEPLLKQIFKTDLRTFVANTVGGITTDCPHRERRGYGETAIGTTWGDGLPWYDSGAFYWSYLQTWAETQRKDGYFVHSVPDVVGGGGTAWSCYPVVGAVDFLNQFDDLDLVKRVYPQLCRWLSFLMSKEKDGLLQRYEFGEWDFLGDWATPDGDDWGDSREALYFNNCCYAVALWQCAELARRLNRVTDAAAFDRKHASLARNVEKCFLRPDGFYCRPDARYQAIALWGKIVPAEREQTVYAAMIRIIREKGYLDGGSVGTSVLLRLLSKTKEGNETVLHWMQSQVMPSYGAFLKAGETTWPEMWDMRDIYGGSRIHTCYTGCAGWFAKGLAGIAICGENIHIIPFFPPQLTWLTCTVESIYGPVACQWYRVEGEILLTVEVPFSARVQLDINGVAHLLYNGTHHFTVSPL